MAPAVEALSAHHCVFTFSLEASAGRSVFDRSESVIDESLDRADLRDAAIIGVSFGGLLALTSWPSSYAARPSGCYIIRVKGRRTPARTTRPSSRTTASTAA